MRRYKTVARILFIISVVHLALAAPAIGRPGHRDVAEDVTAAPEKRASDDESDSISSGSSGSSGSSSSLGDSYHLPHPGSVVSMNFGYDSEELANSPEREPVPVSDSSRHLAELTDSGSDRYYLALEDPDDSSHDLTTPVSGSTSSHLSAGPSTREDRPDPADPEEKTPLLGQAPQSDDPGPGSPSEKHEIVPVLVPPGPEAPGTAPKSAPAFSEHSWSSVATAASKATPEADKFFTDELMAKIKDYSILGTVAGFASGLITSVQKEIMGTISPGAYVSALFPPSPADIYPSHKHSDL
jgi:hypothetical protein